MTYEQAIDYINNMKAYAPEPGLDRMRELMAKLGNVQDKLRYVHVGGTNGKGSTCAMLSSVLRSAGYKVGMFTSPYLQRYNERVQINGEPIPDEALARLVTKIAEAEKELPFNLIEFELDTALGFLWFAECKCDVVVLEVGLGGTFDQTNIIKVPDCAVITNIGLDHMKVLGDTVEKIAVEKSGIIKEGGSVAMYDCGNDNVISYMAKVCREKGASFRLAEFDEIEPLYDGLDGQEFCYCDDEPLFLPLLGDHQLKNAAVVLETIEILRENGYKISLDDIKDGLSNVSWPARFELVSDEPCFIVDGGHNTQCAEAVRDNLLYYFEDTKRILLLGIMADKDVDGFLNIIAPAGDAYVCVTPDSPRALPAEELAKKLAAFGKPAVACSSIEDGIKTAMRTAGKKGMVCAVGSLYMAGDIRNYFGL